MSRTKKGFPSASSKTGLQAKLDLESLDGRTSVSRAAKRLEKALTEYIGPDQLAGQLLINRVIYKAIKLHFYEQRSLQGNLGEDENQYYLPMANSLRQDLEALRKMAGGRKAPSLEEYLKHIKVVE